MALLGRLRGRQLVCRLLNRRQLDVEPERAHLLDEHVEALGDAGLEGVVAADDRLVDLGAPSDVVRLDREHLLQGVCRAVGLERPDLHLAEALTAELGLAAERLLGDEAVGTDRARVDLVVDEVVQLQHIDVAHRHPAIESLAGAPVVERHLARPVEAGHLEHVLDVGLLGAVEHRRGHRHAATQVVADLDEVGIGQPLQLAVAIDLLHLVAQRLHVPVLEVRIDRLGDLLAEAGGGPAEMGFEDLSDVHAARHAERVQHDVDLRAVLEERHVLERHDLRDHALVAVAAGHLVAGLDLALHGDEDLDHLHDAGRKLIAALQLLDLVEEALLEALLRLVVLLLHGLDLGHQPIVDDRELPPLRARVLVQKVARDGGVLLEALRPGDRLVTDENVGEAGVGVAVEDRLLVVAVLGEALDLLALDRLGALVLVDAVAVEDAHLDDRAGDARRHTQRGVAHVRGLLAEDGAQELLLRRHRALALRRDLADEDVAGVDLGTDVDNAGLVEVLQRLFRYVRDVARDLLRPELRIAGHHLEFLDVDRGEDVVLDDPLGEQDRILEVVAVPRHERDEDVAVERTTMRVASTWSTTPARRAAIAAPLSRATTASMPVPTNGASDCTSGTAWRCMFEPMRARLASSFSRNGMSAAATETSCFGDTSMRSTRSGATTITSPARRQTTRSSVRRLLSSMTAFAWATLYFASSMAER